MPTVSIIQSGLIRISGVAMILFFLLTAGSVAQPRGEEVRVAMPICPPFVMEEFGQVSGLSAFLWDEIAKELGIEYQIEVQDLSELFDNISSGIVDVGVSCLSLSVEREKLVDFSHSFFETNLAIAVKKKGYLSVLKRFIFSPQILMGLAIILGTAALVGAVFYLLEHKVNQKLYYMKSTGGKLVEALLIGLLFVTRGPIRYYEFKTSTARLLAAILGIGSTVLIAAVTAVLASAFTLNQLRTEISGPKELSKVRVGTLAGSTSATYLAQSGIPSQTYSTIDQLLRILDNGAIDAVVFDAPALKYEIQRGKEEGRLTSLEVLPYEFQKQNYAIAAADDNPLLEEINRALLKIRKTPEWRNEIVKYLGE